MKQKREPMLRRASRMKVIRCGDPQCQSVHLICCNDKNIPLVDAALHVLHIPELVQQLQHLEAEIMLEALERVEEAERCKRMN